jgi:glycine/D-amino acid oxidase-like deaminating enzyme
MRADVGVLAFQQEMRGDAEFFVVGEGLSAIIKGLEDECRAAGVEILLGEAVSDVRRVGGGGWRVRTEGGAEFVSDRVVLAMPVAALRQLPVLRGWNGLGRLGMEPLTRIYAKYPSLSWYSGPKTVTDSPLRYVIPINREEGTIMISYTDDRDTRFWKSPSSATKGLKDGRELTTAIQREVRRLWPRAPQPQWVHRYEWSTGCSYWRPGDYEPTDVIREALELQPGLHICGESFSLRQAWVEGGLESAADLVERLT